MAGAGTTAAGLSVLLDFDDAVECRSWAPVNDAVMGGISRSEFTQAQPGIARFAGIVSLENSGGFASARTTPRAWHTAGARAFVLRVRGDGKGYKFTIRTDDAFDGIQYQSRFAPPAAQWRDVRLPVDSFAATFRGRNVPGAPALDPARVRILGLTISDRQAGAFELLIDWVAAEIR